MMLGTYNQLKVVRESDIAYILTDDFEEIFLHKKEAEHPYLPGEMVEVFIYVDNLGRPTASTKEAFVTIDKPAFLSVVSVNPKYGVFLHYGLVKDLLLSKDDLPFELDLWPHIGDRLFVCIKEKKFHLFAKIIGRKQIAHYFDQEIRPLEVGDTVEATVLFLMDEGVVCFSSRGDEIFVHVNNTREPYRIGQIVRPKILKQNPNLEYSATLIEQKEKMITSDGEALLEYMQNHHGEMRFTDKSSPEDILYAFKMSKSAYKRALGGLYKSGLVELHPDKTTLKLSK